MQIGERDFELTAEQQPIVGFAREAGGGLAVVGSPGTGKTTALVARLLALAREGRLLNQVLVLVPQRAYVERYEQALALADAPTRGGAEIATYYGLCRRLVGLFWPLAAASAGMDPVRDPTFLTIETAQYYMWQLVEPLIRSEGYFSDLAIRRDRLLSQLVDNLNKSALVGFPVEEIAARLRGAWTGDPERQSAFVQAQDCALRFRTLCRQHNLLDFSLTTELFDRCLLPHPAFQDYLRGRFRHLLVDNLEENVPAAQRLVRWLLPNVDSAVLAVDRHGGHRVFLGADAQGADGLLDACRERLELTERVAGSPRALHFAEGVRRALRLPADAPTAAGDEAVQVLPDAKYWIGMVRAAAERVAQEIAAGCPAHRIAILAPYVSEVLRFALEQELQARGVELFLLRPSTPLREQPTVRGLLMLAVLAHPTWTLSYHGEPWQPNQADVSLALQVAIAGLDPVRARLLARQALPIGERSLVDLSGEGGGDGASADLGRLWDQVGYQVREAYDELQRWLATYGQGEPLSLDMFYMLLFGEVLSRPGFALHNDLDAARACGRLVESTMRFAEGVGREGRGDAAELGRAYVELILGGIASAEYLLDWPTKPPEDKVILSTAFAYVTRDLRSEVQVWLDLGSDGWWNRPNQPLTQPYVLSQHWPVGRPWREIEEDQSRRETLGKLVYGLAARCDRLILLGSSELGVNGVEQSGPLERAVLRALAAGRKS